MRVRSLTIIVALVALALVPSNAFAGAPKSKLRFSATSFAVAENAGTATVAVTRAPRNGKAHSGTNSVVSVGFSTADGSAVAGTDYTATSGRVTFPACSGTPAATDPCLRQTIAIPITDDSVVDGNKTVRLSLTTPSRNAVVVNPQKAALTIADNEGPTHISFDATDYKVWELGPSVEIHVIRSGAGISGSSAVDFATADGTAHSPGDYTAQSSTLSFAPGEVDKTVLVNITDDAVVEPTETFNVNLANATGGATIDTPTAPVTILDDDAVVPAHLALDATTYSVSEGGDVTVTVNRTNAVDGPVSVDYATIAQSAGADVDFAAAADTLDFDPGDTSQSFTISTLPDSLHEGDETFGLALSNAVPSGTVIDTGNATVTIADDDPVPTVSAGSATTDGSNVSFVIQLSNPTTQDVTVTYVITDANGNQVGTGTATIPAGSTSTTVQIPDGGNGPYSITLSNPSGGTLDGSHSSASTQPPAGGSGSGSGSGDSSSGATEDPVASVPGASAPIASFENPAATEAAVVLAGTGGGACKLVFKAGRLDKHGVLALTLRAGRACTVTVGASVKSGGKTVISTRVLRALKTKRQTLKLRAGQMRTLKLRFTARGLGFIKRAVAAKRPLTLTLTVIERDARNRVTKQAVRSKLHVR
jgi:Calx-beta domain